MRIMQRSCWAVLSSTLVCVPSFAQAPQGAAAPAPAAAANAVAATVNGQPVPEMALYRALRPVPPPKQAEARAEILNYLIDNIIIDQYLKEQKIDVTPAEVDGRVAEMQKQLQAQKLEFAKVLKDMMLTEAELREHIAAEIRWEKYVNSRATEAMLREMFTKSPESYDGTLVHARHILLTPPPADAKANEEAKAQLLAIRNQLEAQVAQELAKLPPTADALTRQRERARVLDETFGAIAKQKSACPSKEQGGDVGSFPRTGHMVEPFAAAAFALKPYELSNVVTTQFGHHLILCVERRPGKETKFEDAKENIKEVYSGQLHDAIIAQLRPKANIAVTK